MDSSLSSPPPSASSSSPPSSERSGQHIQWTDCQPSLKSSNCKLSPGLYLIPTPIGNLGDITLRALQTMQSVDALYCEKPRLTAQLLGAYGLKNKLSTYEDHTGDGVRLKILDTIRAGKAIGLVSDAGMPLISDPGYKLVQLAIQEGIQITALPGPSAVMVALAVSGLAPLPFAFLGFPPPKAGKRLMFYKRWQTFPGTMVLFESPRRVHKTLLELEQVMGDRRTALARELTKLYEEISRGTLSELQVLLAQREADGKSLKGECVILVSGAPDAYVGEPEKKLQDIETRLRELLLTHKSLKDAVAQVVQETGCPRRTVYQSALKVQRG